MTKSISAKRTIVLANTAVLLFYLFIGLVVMLHLLRHELNPFQQFVSEYAVDHYGFFMMLAFLCLCAGSIFLLLAAAKIVWQCRKGVILILLFVWCACIFTAAIYSTDIAGTPETLHGHIHNNASMLGFACIIVCAFLTTGLYKREKQKKYYRPFLLLSLLMLIAFIVMMACVITGNGFVGLVQRFFIITVIGWLITTANTIKSISRY